MTNHSKTTELREKFMDVLTPLIEYLVMTGGDEITPESTDADNAVEDGTLDDLVELFNTQQLALLERVEKEVITPEPRSVAETRILEALNSIREEITSKGES